MKWRSLAFAFLMLVCSVGFAHTPAQQARVDEINEGLAIEWDTYDTAVDAFIEAMQIPDLFIAGIAAEVAEEALAEIADYEAELEEIENSHTH